MRLEDIYSESPACNTIKNTYEKENTMKIALGSDHGGFNLKNTIIEHLKQKGIETVDFGTYDTNSCDYPDYAAPVCDSVIAGEADFGILVCGTGVGMSIAANKIKGIRCALIGNVFSAKATREHNNSNVLALGERATGPGLALEIVDAYLGTEYSNEPRHTKRIEKIAELEKR